MPSFPYNNLIPQPTDQLSVSQGQILTNFGSIKSLVDIDHVDFANNDAGKHNKSSYVTQSPAPTFAATEVGIYNFVYPTTTKNEGYVHKQTSASTAEIPFTASILSTSLPAILSAGWTYLPSGILLKWGSSTTNAAVQNFPTSATIPVFTVCLHVIASINGTQTGATINAVPTSATQFLATVSSGANMNFSYLAIGY